MKNLTRVLFKFFMKLIMTPILLLITIVILVVYTLAGCIFVPAQTFRFMGLTTLAAVQSAFLNRDNTNIFLDALYEFFRKYMSFYEQIIHIPLAIWIPAEENPSNLLKLLEYQWKVLSENWLSTIIVFFTIIFSFVLSFSLLGIKALDYLHLDRLKEKLFSSPASADLAADPATTFQLAQANNKIDSLQTLINDLKEERQKDNAEIKNDKTPEAVRETYSVKPGDGLLVVARKFKVTIDKLREWNKLTDDKLQIGQKLIIK